MRAFLRVTGILRQALRTRSAAGIARLIHAPAAATELPRWAARGQHAIVPLAQLTDRLRLGRHAAPVGHGPASDSFIGEPLSFFASRVPWRAAVAHLREAGLGYLLRFP
jgi:hypothetical protein